MSPAVYFSYIRLGPFCQKPSGVESRVVSNVVVFWNLEGSEGGGFRGKGFVVLQMTLQGCVPVSGS